MKTNFHTHHRLCGHAGGTCEDYVEEALKHNLEELGFSDHAPNDEMDLGYRMHDDDFWEYLDDIKYVQSKYSDQLTIYKGIEIEYFYNNKEYYAKFLANLDYLMLGQHFVFFNKDNSNRISSFGLSTKEEIECYADILCDAMQTGMFKIIAHPELYMHGYINFDQHAEQVAHRISKCAEQTKTILEFNANGYRRSKIHTPQGFVHPYPRKEFWKIVEQYDVRTIFSSDCHNPKQLNDHHLKEAEEVYNKLSTTKITYYDQF